ncbi:MAG: glutamate-1-semialdehyde 2,1-aminomutase [Thermoguttaceae bacterium]|nr:glutamate-1-semialdehyde 2,1-aminomutase [Thermoguttaceae bacterium]
MNFTASRAIFAKTENLIPGGVNSPARAFGAVGGNPLVIDRGSGSKIYDADGNEFIDYVLSWGPLIVGHAHPAVIDAVGRAVKDGLGFGAPTRGETEIAELLIALSPSLEKVRLVSSGTEATSSAIRLARGYTGRDKIVKFRGCYHGHVDSLLVAAGSAAATFGVPNSPGITPGCAADTIVLEYNDADGVKEAFSRCGREIAGVIVEPVAGNMGVVPGKPEFLQTLRDETRAAGAVLIFDEVMSGLRVALGSAQSRYGITPDLSTFGKVIGGGLPVAAYGGKAEIMNAVIPVGKVFQAGTLSGNPVAVAAGLATLKILAETKNFHADLEEKTARLARGLEEAARRAGVTAVAQKCGAMFTLFFNDPADREVTDWPSAARCDEKLFARYFWGMIERGVYLPCSQFEANFTSSAHTDEDIERTIAAADDLFASF